MGHSHNSDRGRLKLRGFGGGGRLISSPDPTQSKAVQRTQAESGQAPFGIRSVARERIFVEDRHAHMSVSSDPADMTLVLSTNSTARDSRVDPGQMFVLSCPHLPPFHYLANWPVIST